MEGNFLAAVEHTQLRESLTSSKMVHNQQTYDSAWSGVWGKEFANIMSGSPLLLLLLFCPL